jgi:predicted O-linked N-acetylglucosamine transferase (SPINDLY family)
LSREAFDVSVFTVGAPGGQVGAKISAAADRCFTLPPALPAARDVIRQQQLDVLFYTDVGMDPVTYSLACSRLAPVQCTTWGHPVTSGIPTIDYFISSEALEPPGAETLYTEKLVRLDSLAVNYERPKNIAARPRAAFGLADDVHLYGCLQMLWKFHPEFDEVICGILRRDPQARVLLIRGLNRRWDDLLTARFCRVMPDVADRIIWLPRQAYEDFLAITALCDVMLDPLHFGGGNTSYEALAMGVPVITLPSQLMRGRITFALYGQMKFADCVATSKQDFVERAVRFCTDRDYRSHVVEQICARSDAIFNDLTGVRQLEQFFIDVNRA